jgi:hypothetical protein
LSPFRPLGRRPLDELGDLVEKRSAQERLQQEVVGASANRIQCVLELPVRGDEECWRMG